MKKLLLVGMMLLVAFSKNAMAETYTFNYTSNIVQTLDKSMIFKAVLAATMDDAKPSVNLFVTIRNDGKKAWTLTNTDFLEITLIDGTELKYTFQGVDKYFGLLNPTETETYEIMYKTGDNATTLLNAFNTKKIKSMKYVNMASRPYATELIFDIKSPTH